MLKHREWKRRLSDGSRTAGWLLAVILFLSQAGPARAVSQDAAPTGSARVTILYDNTTAREGVTSDWGFSCLIEGLSKTILFDAPAAIAEVLRIISERHDIKFVYMNCTIFQEYERAALRI